jgi:molybdate transport system substrate-binding protein
MMHRLPALLLGLAIPLGACAGAWAGSLKVAAASSTQDALQEIAARFEQETGHQVRLTFGSSAKLFTQLTQGAPFGVYFSADDEYPAKLHALGLSEAPRRYATGRLVLWAPAGSPLDVKRGLSVLSAPGIRKVAIANPKVAPYGRAAEEALRAEKVYGQVAGKFVMGENVTQAAQFVESGSAEAGLLPLSLAVSPKLAPRGKYALIPTKLHQPIDADAVVLKQAEDATLAHQFFDYCLSPKATPTWRRYGLREDE